MASSSSNTTPPNTDQVKTLFETAAAVVPMNKVWQAWDRQFTALAESAIQEIQGAAERFASASSTSSSSSVADRIYYHDTGPRCRPALRSLGIAELAKLKNHVLYEEVCNLPAQIIELFSHPLMKGYARQLRAREGRTTAFALPCDTERSSLAYRLRYELTSSRDAADNQRVQEALDRVGGDILNMPNQVLNIVSVRKPSIQVLDLSGINLQLERFTEITTVFSYLEELHLNTGICLASSGHKPGKPHYYLGLRAKQVDSLHKALPRLKRLHLRVMPKDSRVPGELQGDALLAFFRHQEFVNGLEQLRLSGAALSKPVAKKLATCNGLQGLHLDCLQSASDHSFLEIMEALEPMVEGENRWRNLKWLSIEGVQGIDGELNAAESEAFRSWLRRLVCNNPNLRELRLLLTSSLLDREFYSDCERFLRRLQILELYDKKTPLTADHDSAEGLRRFLRSAPIQWLSIAEVGLKGEIPRIAPNLRYLQSKLSLGLGTLSSGASNFEEINLRIPPRFAPDCHVQFLRVSLNRVHTAADAGPSAGRFSRLVDQLEGIRRDAKYYDFWKFVDDSAVDLITSWGLLPHMNEDHLSKQFRTTTDGAHRELFSRHMRKHGCNLRILAALRGWREADAREREVRQRLGRRELTVTQANEVEHQIEAEKQLYLRTMGRVEDASYIETEYKQRYGDAKLQQWLANMGEDLAPLEEHELRDALADLKESLEMARLARIQEIAEQTSAHGDALRRWLVCAEGPDPKAIRAAFDALEALTKKGAKADADEIEATVMSFYTLVCQALAAEQHQGEVSDASSSSSQQQALSPSVDSNGHIFLNFLTNILMPESEKRLRREIGGLARIGEDMALLSLRKDQSGGQDWLEEAAWPALQRLAALTPKLEFLQLAGALSIARVVDALRMWPNLKELHLVERGAGEALRQILREEFPGLYVRIGEASQDPYEQYRSLLVRLEVLQEISMS